MYIPTTVIRARSDQSSPDLTRVIVILIDFAKRAFVSKNFVRLVAINRVPGVGENNCSWNGKVLPDIFQ
jgi:hypothetical protein